MLSTSNIKNTGQASHYFSQHDNYYTKDEGKEHSEWWGKGAEKLSLSGPVDPKQFTDLLNGLLPNGQKLGKLVDGEMLHRAGWDLTFSAPKSVSIMALIGGDTRLIEAHQQAVKKALSNVERSCSQARVKTSDGMQYQNTGNMISALYHHDLSRTKDPQLHTHCITMNMTERNDGKWRSQASQLGRYDQSAKGEINGFIERVNHNRRYFTKVYETQLAYAVKQLGYEITTNTKSGIFEIVAVPGEVLKHFSKRRTQIEEQLVEKGLSGGKSANIAALATRETKSVVNRENLTEKWHEEAKQFGFDYKYLIENTYIAKNEKSQQTASITQKHLQEHINIARKNLSAFKTTFTLEELVTEAADFAIKNSFDFQSLFTQVEAQIQSGDLIAIANEKGKSMFMAKETLHDENRLSDSLSDQKRQTSSLEQRKITKAIAKNKSISSKRDDDLKTIFDNDRVVILEGAEARRTLIEPIMHIAKDSRMKVALLSPTIAGSKYFARDSKLETHTVWEHIKNIFINTQPKHYSVMQFTSEFDSVPRSNRKKPDLLIVDNAHLLSTHQKANLVEWNRLHNTKMVLLSENRGLLPQKNGIGIDDISRLGIKTISLQSSDQPFLKNNTEMFKTLLQQCSGKIRELKATDARFNAMASQYCNLNDDVRSQSWLVSHHKTAIQQLNKLVHDELKEQNKLGKAVTVPILIPVFLNEGKAALASSYQKNQVVRFNENYSSLKVVRGEYLRVVRNSKGSNRVLLQNEHGDRIIWRPDLVGGSSGKVELFTEQQRELCLGETIQFYRSLKSLDIVAGERALITKVASTYLKIKNEDGKTMLLDLSKSQHRHIDYSYAATPHAIAHTKPHTIISDLPAKDFLTDQRRFYQLVSQPRDAWIYTDDQLSLIDHLEKKTGNKISAQETLNQSEEINRNAYSLYDILEKKIDQRDKMTLSRAAVNAIEYAMDHLAEREAGFTHKQLMQTAMTHALGEVNDDSLLLAASQIEKAGLLVRGDRDDGTLWTTMDAVKIEQEIVFLCEKDIGKLQPIVSDSLVKKFCDENKLSTEQIDAIKAITQNKDRVLAIQGHPGTGKTTMLATVVDILAARSLLTSQGYELLGLAPTNVAVQELTTRGIAAQTLDSFILENMDALQNKLSLEKRSNLILVIDEASMVSNRKMLDVLRIAHSLDCRAIPAGDVRQLASPEAGRPHHLIQHTAVETKHLVQIRRQENPTLIQAVKETIDFDFKAALNTLKESITEINVEQGHDNQSTKEDLFAMNRKERIGRLVTDYFSYPKDQREFIQIITPGHDDRLITNAQIREQLKQEGSLAAEDHSFSILTSRSMTQIERSHITNLSVGDVLRFGKRDNSHIKAGEYLTILELHHDNRMIKLKSEKGKEIAWQVPQYDKKRLNQIEVFKKESRPLQVGDVIRWSRTNKVDELLSSESAKVQTIKDSNITVELASKKIFTFDSRNPKYQHWDHGYAATVFAVQGKTKDIVLALLESYRENLTSQSSFLVALTRAVNQFRLYTDNTKQLLNRLEKNTGVKMSALEVVGKYPSRKIKLNTPKENTPTLLDAMTSLKNKSEFQPPLFNRMAISSIKEGLNQDAERVAISILGKPKERGAHYLKFGSNNGSLTVTTKGEKQGWFNDFATNQGGRDMIKFLQIHGEMDKEEALKFGANWLGIVSVKSVSQPSTREQKPHKTKQIIDSGFSPYELKRIALAKQLSQESIPIKGTLAEKYLCLHRGIEMENYSNDIRFHPKIYSAKNQKTLPALLAIARDKEGQVQSVEAIYLDSKTADKANVLLQKQTIGPKKGAAVILKQTTDLNAPTLVAEGVVTGLSIAKAIPNVNVAISLGKQMFTSIDPKMVGDRVVFCLDNDGKKLTLDPTILAASTRLTDSKKDVSFMIPRGLSTKKQDYNDILKHRGSEVIHHDFLKAVPYLEFYKSDGKDLAKSTEDSTNYPNNKIIISVLQNEKKSVTDKVIARFAKEISGTQNDSSKRQPTLPSELAVKEVEKNVSILKEIEREI